MGETRSAANLLHQARIWADADLHLKVVYNLYQLRFDEVFDQGLTLRQVRGMEGARVRDAYAKAARETGVSWAGRSYQRENWADADPVNRALSAANSCLYGICHAAIVSAGFLLRSVSSTQERCCPSSMTSLILTRRRSLSQWRFEQRRNRWTG